MISMFICDNGSTAIGVRYIFSIYTATKIELTDILPGGFNPWVISTSLRAGSGANFMGGKKSVYLKKNMKTAGF